MDNLAEPLLDDNDKIKEPEAMGGSSGRRPSFSDAAAYMGDRVRRGSASLSGIMGGRRFSATIGLEYVLGLIPSREARGGAARESTNSTIYLFLWFAKAIKPILITWGLVQIVANLIETGFYNNQNVEGVYLGIPGQRLDLELCYPLGHYARKYFHWFFDKGSECLLLGDGGSNSITSICRHLVLGDKFILNEANDSVSGKLLIQIQTGLATGADYKRAVLAGSEVASQLTNGFIRHNVLNVNGDAACYWEAFRDITLSLLFTTMVLFNPWLHEKIVTGYTAVIASLVDCFTKAKDLYEKFTLDDVLRQHETGRIYTLTISQLLQVIEMFDVKGNQVYVELKSLRNQVKEYCSEQKPNLSLILLLQLWIDGEAVRVLDWPRVWGEEYEQERKQAFIDEFKDFCKYYINKNNHSGLVDGADFLLYVGDMLRCFVEECTTLPRFFMAKFASLVLDEVASALSRLASSEVVSGDRVGKGNLQKFFIYNDVQVHDFGAALLKIVQKVEGSMTKKELVVDSGHSQTADYILKILQRIHMYTLREHLLYADLTIEERRRFCVEILNIASARRRGANRRNASIARSSLSASSGGDVLVPADAGAGPEDPLLPKGARRNDVVLDGPPLQDELANRGLTEDEIREVVEAVNRERRGRLRGDDDKGEVKFDEENHEDLSVGEAGGMPQSSGRNAPSKEPKKLKKRKQRGSHPPELLNTLAQLIGDLTWQEKSGIPKVSGQKLNVYRWNLIIHALGVVSHADYEFPWLSRYFLLMVIRYASKILCFMNIFDVIIGSYLWLRWVGFYGGAGKLWRLALGYHDQRITNISMSFSDVCEILPESSALLWIARKLGDMEGGEDIGADVAPGQPSWFELLVGKCLGRDPAYGQVGLDPKDPVPPLGGFGRGRSRRPRVLDKPVAKRKQLQDVPPADGPPRLPDDFVDSDTSSSEGSEGDSSGSASDFESGHAISVGDGGESDGHSSDEEKGEAKRSGSEGGSDGDHQEHVGDLSELVGEKPVEPDGSHEDSGEDSAKEISEDGRPQEPASLTPDAKEPLRANRRSSMPESVIRALLREREESARALLAQSKPDDSPVRKQRRGSMIGANELQKRAEQMSYEEAQRAIEKANSDVQDAKEAVKAAKKSISRQRGQGGRRVSVDLTGVAGAISFYREAETRASELSGAHAPILDAGGEGARGVRQV